MLKEYASLRRRPFLTPVWILGFLGLFALGVAAWAVREASTTLVLVTRHAEKLADAVADPALSPAGLARAQRLASLLGDAPRELAVDAVFVTQWQRTASTALSLATRLGIPVIPVAAEDLAGLEARIRREYRGRRVLVIAHSDSVPVIVADLSQGAKVPPIADGEYGAVYLVAIPRWSRPSVLAMRLP